MVASHTPNLSQHSADHANILEYKQMEKLLKETLNTSKLNVLGQFGGYIAKEAAGYEIDGGKQIFVKCGVRESAARDCFIFYFYYSIDKANH